MVDRTFKRVTGSSSIAEFKRRVSRLGPAAKTKLRHGLLERFDAVVEYKDADEWARAVSLCEALAVVGWGKRERVDAKAHFDGDCWETYFINARGEFRFLQSRWSRRKLGWQPFNPEYHWSPDRPKVPAQDWDEYPHEETVPVLRDKLPSQVNYQRQMPIVMGMCGGLGISSRVARLKTELDALLTKYLKPEEYGPELEFFYFTLHCSTSSARPESGLKIGAYRPKQKSYYCDLHFAPSFIDLGDDEQKMFFQSNLLAALERLQETFAKKKLSHDFAGLRKDMDRAFRAWRSV